MTVLKNRQIGKTVAVVIAVVMLLAVAIPAVSAYEAHIVNVQAYVKEHLNMVKTARLATDTEIQDAIGLGAIFPETLLRPYPPVTVTDPANVPIETCVVWVVTIAICNPHDYIMYNVEVTDNFSAELNGVEMPDCPYDVVVPHIAKGRWKKTLEPNQIRIDWDDFNLEIGECATLELLVWLRNNPAGHQEYTSEGCYTLNSGPTSKWLDDTGHQVSFDGAPLYVKTTGWGGACP